jgi:hypothetical protein
MEKTNGIQMMVILRDANARLQTDAFATHLTRAIAESFHWKFLKDPDVKFPSASTKVIGTRRSKGVIVTRLRLLLI